MATKSTLSGLFGPSPFKALQHHSRLTTDCAILVVDLFNAVCEGRKEEIAGLFARIDALESEADQIKDDMRSHLPKSIFMPVDRRDILEILDFQDSIADLAQDIAGLVHQRQMDVPPPIKVPLLNLTRRSVDACKHLNLIVNQLDELVATGFRGRESEMVADMVQDLNKIESDSDAMGADLSRALFAIEKTVDPVSVILWFDLFKMIGGLADYAEKVGNRLRLLLA